MSDALRRVPIALILALAGCSASAHAPQASPAVQAVGARAPAFTARALDGTAISSDAYRGKTLVLNFFATWCPPCRAETPDLIKAYGNLHANDVAFLAVDTTESAPIVKAYAALRGMPYPIAIAGPDTYNAYGIAYIPTTIVIDPNGIERARWTGEIVPGQLASYVASARAGKNALYVTAEQRTIDALLTFSPFDVNVAQARLEKVAAYQKSLNGATTLRYDTIRTQSEVGGVELQIANALLAKAKTPSERVVAYEERARAESDLNRYADAVADHERALALSIHDPKIVANMTRAYYRLHDYPAMERTALAWTKLAPNDPDAWDQLGLSQQRQGAFARAVPAYQRALALLIETAHAAPIGKDGDAVAAVADESLDYANLFVALGDAARARTAFDQAQRYAALIPSASPYAPLKERASERTAEGLAGASLAHGSQTRLTLTAWSGADLPGSAASNIRYRLVAVAPAGKSVTLVTKGLKPGWIASFCQDRLCSPNTVTFIAPPEGVKTYEFQLIAPDASKSPGRVLVGATDAAWVATP
jgi:thiol-disulfide isomerase/thioredoxin